MACYTRIFGVVHLLIQSSSYYELEVEMSSMTMHGIEPDLDRRLREEAAAKGLSLNQTLKKLLSASVCLEGSSTDHRKEYEEFFGVWSKEDAAAFTATTSDFDRVDPEDWK
jgi:hypothetical protein